MGWIVVETTCRQGDTVDFAYIDLGDNLPHPATGELPHEPTPAPMREPGED